LGMLVFMFTGLVVNAQDNKKEKTPEDRATKVCDKLKEELGLTEEQYSKVYEIQLALQTKLAETKEKCGEDKECMKENMKGTKKESKAKIEEVLTEEQLVIYNAPKEKKK